MAFNRDLSQFASYLSLDAAGKYIGITPAESETNVGIGRTNPTSKLDVVGDASITGVVTATQFYGNLDYSYILNATAGVRTEFSVVDNGGDGSLSYDGQTGIISYVGPSAAEARVHFSATSSDLGSLVYSAETGVFAYSGVTTANIRDQFTGGTGVTITEGEVAIGQPVGTNDSVTFAAVNSTGIVTATEFVTGAEGSAIHVKSDRITGPSTIILDPSAIGDDTGVVVIKGDLQVEGETTTINSTTVTINDKNIQIADGAINDAAADGAGITVNSGDGDKTFQFNDASDAFKSNISLDVASGEVYKIDGTEVLSADTLGSGVVNSSLTSVGTLGQLEVSGVTTSTGGFSGNLTGDVTGNADTATALETGRDFSISGDAEASAITFDGTANVGLALTLVDTAVTPGSYGSSSEIPTFTVDSKGRLTAAGTVSVSTGMTVAGDSGSEIIDLLSETLTIAGGTNLTSSAASDTVTIDLNNDISLTSVTASGVVTATSGFVGDLTGDVTGNLTGEVNAAAFDTNASGVVVTGVTTSTSGFVGDLTGNVTGDLTGNADTATALETGRDFSASGDASAPSVTFDGTGNVDLVLTLADTSVVAGSYGSSSEIPTFTVDSKGRLTAAGTTSVGTDLTVAGDTGSETIQLLSETLTIAGGTNLTSSAASDTVTINLDDNISLTSVTASGIVTAAEFVTGASGEAIGINTNTISGPETLILDPAAVGDNTGKVVIKGDLQVDGTQTIVNSTTVTVADKNIQIADGAANDAAADGAGITVNSGDGDKTFQFNDASDAFKSNISLDVASGEVYKINGTEVLSSTTLGSNVVTSSLTSVGTLGQLEVSGVTTSTGGFVGNLTGDVTGNADTATALETGRDFSISGDAEASAITFDGTSNVGLALTLVDTAVTPGSYGSSSEIPTFTVDSKGRLTAAGTVSVSTGMTVAGDSGSETINLLSETLTIAGGTNLTSSAASDTVTINLDDNISLVSVVASGVVTATSGFVGDLTGNVTGDLTGEVNAAAFDTNASGVVVTGVATATSGFVGNLTGDVTGNADTATALETGRTISLSGDLIGEVVFDGTSNVSIAATIQPDSVALGSDTTGDYVESIADSGSSDITVSGSGESAAVTLGLTTTGVVAGSYGSSSEIPTFSVDSRGRLTAAGTVSVSTGMTVAGDSGSEVIDLLTETLTIAGGTNLTSSAASDTVTINLDDNISLVSVVASGIVTAAEFVTGASGQAIGINTNTISGPETLILDPAAVGDDTGLVVIKGDLQIDGTTTTINSTTVNVDDKNVVLGSGAINDAAADGGGITLESGDGNKTWNWVDSTDSWTSSEHIDAASGKVYKIGGTEVLSSDTLGSGVINSSLTSVGTLGQLEVSGVTTSTGGFVGDLTGEVTGNVTGNLTGEVNAAAFDTNASGVVVTGVTTSTSGFVGDLTGNVTGNVTGDVTGNVTGDLTGEVNAAAFDTNASGVVVTGITTSTGGFVGDLTGNVTGNLTGEVNATAFDTNASGVVVTGVTTSTSGFVGNLTGNVTGDLTGNVTGNVTGDLTGNVTGNLTGEVNAAAFDTNASGVVVTGVTTSTSGFVGDLTGNVTGDVTGNADTATALETGRDFSASGDASAPSVTFDGTGNVDLVLTLADTGVAAGSYGSSTEIPTFTVDSKGRLTVAGTASVGTALTVAGDSGSEVIDLLSETLTIAGGTNLTSSAAGDTVTLDLDGDINLDSVNATGIITAAQFVTGASGEAIGINTNTISGPATITIDPAAVGDDTGLVVIKGDLQVDGTQTIINSTTVTVNDLNVMLADGAANDAAADGGGITVQSGDGNKTFQFEATGDNFGSSENMNLASGKVYKINNTEVLSSTTLGSNVVTSSLTSVGTLGQLNVSGVTTSSGGFSGNLTGDVTGNADTATALETGRDFSISGDAEASAITFDGTSNVGLALTLADTGVAAGSYGSSTEIPTFTVDSKGRLTVAGTASVGTALTVAGDSGSEVINLLTETLTIAGGTNLTSSAASDTLTLDLDSDISLDNISATGIVTASSGFVGDLTGDVIGNLNSSGLSTVTNLEVGGYISVGSTTGTNEQVMISTGAGVTWTSIADILPQTRTGLTTTAANGQTAFSFAYNVNYLDVFVNGVKLSNSDFTATNGTDITLTEATFSGDKVEFISYNTAGTGSGSGSGSGPTVSDDTSTDATFYPVFTQTTTGTIASSNVSTTKLSFNPSTGTLNATNVNSTSDRNLKDNIRPVENASELVNKLEGVHFTWKDNGSESVGVIAQQIEEHLPQLIHQSETHKSVNYNGLVGVLIEAVKEQGAQIAALKAEIEELKK